MNFLALIIGIIAVAFYLLGYQQKKRKNIILFNATSRVLYIIQYILLSAFEGAVLDIAGIVSSLLAQKKESPFIKKHIKIFVVCVNLLIIASGLMLYKSPVSLLPVAGVLLHTSAFWISDEKIIRQVSLSGCPFWLLYNFLSGAYGSCIGDILSIVSLVTAMLRYDYKKTTILLIRHGESDGNRRGLFAGHADFELVENGIYQAKLAGEYIAKNYNVSHVYSSDLRRARQTAECISEKLGLTPILEENLREIYAGDWQGKEHARLSSLYPDDYPVFLNDIGNAVCTNGESVKQMSERIMAILKKLAEENMGKTIVAVTHAVPIRAVQSILTAGSVDAMKDISFVSNSSVTEIVYKGGNFTLKKAGEDSYLSSCKTTISI